jgi:methylated-DNA-protein-cysteine methyltransferase related protein
MPEPNDDSEDQDPSEVSDETLHSGHGKSQFVENVYAIVLRIPYGRVTTYGRIARAVGAPRSARMVGWAIHNCPDDVSENAHRVINRNGELTGGWSFGHPSIMRGLLEDEGVTFIDEFQVDLSKHLWEPEYEDETDA